MRRRFAALALGASAVALVAAGCGGGGGNGGAEGGNQTSSQGAPSGQTTKGGTYRVSAPSFEYTGGFDPTGEYLGTAWSFYSNMMIRTLMNYKHTAGAAGNAVKPDLADGMPQVSDDGKTYTFKIKQGVKFAPPVDREITSKDILYAFERIGTPKLVAQYGFYYSVIQGMDEFQKAGGLAKAGNKLSGVEAPDDQTIVFHLTEPTGDFLYRLAMPATGPIPEEVAGCFKKAGDYGRDVVSSGPYMFKGADQVDISSCKSIKPMSGFDPTREQIWVRNPNWDESTDTEDLYENNVDEVDYTLNTNVNDIFDKIEKGELDGEIAPEPAQVLKQYSTSADLKDRLKVNSADRTWYVTMTLAQPPFDDIHVRKAMNWVMDKSALQRAWGGPIKGDIAHHIVPDTMFNGDLDDYNPYATQGDAGDLQKAMDEMKQSKYDTDQDGKCDAPECSGVLYVNRNTPPFTDMEPTIVQDAQKIGIKLTAREFEDAYPVIQDATKGVPVSSVPGWGKDYADPSTFMVLFDSASILPQGNVNYSLVGITPEQAKADKIGGNVADIPSVDDKIAACNKETGDQRLSCWEDLDKDLMENVVPWVPYLDATNVDTIGPAVTKYDYDQFSGTTAWTRVAVDPSQQQ